MQTLRLSSRHGIRQLIKKFRSYNHPGALLTGLSQVGKSSTAGSMIEECIAQSFARLDDSCGTTLIDPHHDLTDRIRNFVLLQPNNIRERLNYICPAEGHFQPVNILHWNHPAELPACVDQARRSIKAAYAVAEAKDTSLTEPSIDEWMNAALEATAQLKLPLATAADFLDPFAPHHFHLLQLLGLVNQTLAYKLASISLMRPHDRSQVVGPALRRLHDVLRGNPFVRDLLSVSGTVNAKDWIADRLITLISLKPTDRAGNQLLRPMDVRLLANLYAAPLFNAARSMFGQQQRVPHVLWIDEFQCVADSLAPEIEKSLAELAKVGFKLVGITQTAANFSDGIENRTLQQFLSNAHFLLHFRSQSEIDSLLFSTIPFLYNYRPTVKHVLKQSQQYVAGYTIKNLVSQSYSWMKHAARSKGSAQGYDWGTQTSETDALAITDQTQEATAKATGSRKARSNTATETKDNRTLPGPISNASSSGNTDDVSENLTNTLSNAKSLGRTATTGSGQNQSVNRSSVENYQTGSDKGGSISISPTILPTYGWKEIISSVQFLSETEVRIFWQQLLMRLPRGQCLAQIFELGTAHFVFEKPVDLAKERPSRIAANTEEFFTLLSLNPAYLAPEKLEGQYARLVAGVLEDHSTLDFPPLPQNTLLLPEWITPKLIEEQYSNDYPDPF